MNKKTFKVPPDKRNALVELYMKGGMKAVEPLCKEFGITAKYVANLASMMGKHRRKDAPWRATQTENDKRWEWAIQRGKVIA